MPDEVILDVTTIEENVTVETTAGDVVGIQVVAPTGPAGATGPAGPNSVTSATTSDGTANLSLSNVSTATATVSGLLTAGHIHGNLAGTLYTHVRTGEAMLKGDPFYISGFHVGSSQPIAMKADASNAAKMPAVGVMDADYANNTSGANGIISGTLSSVNTNGYAVNSPIYVANGGGYSNTAGTIPQQIGITERANANTGAFIVTNSKVISFADVSDAQTGTANLSIADLEVVGGEIYTDGEYSHIYTQGDGAEIFTIGADARIYTQGEDAHISTSGANANIYTSGESASISTAGANAAMGTVGANATISTAGSAAHIQTSHASAAVKSTNFAAVESGGASLVDGSMQPCLTWSAGGRNLTIPSGTATTFNTTSYTYGTGAAAAHRTALGLVSNTDLLSSVYEWSKSTADYSATNVGTGTSSTATNVMQLNTLATAGSSALLRSDANDFRAWQKYSGIRQAVDWSKKTMHFARISSDAFSGADTIFRIYLGLPATLTTVQDLQSANTAIGFKVVNGVIFVQVSNGSAVTTTTTGVTMSAWLLYDCMIQSNGDGTWTATVNSTTVTGSGAPTTTSAASNAALIMSATNGTTASARRFFINIQRSMQHD